VNATLPAAEKTGRLTLRPFSTVHSLIFDPKSRKVAGVRVIDSQSRAALEFHAPLIFLCASTLESTRILFNSATPEFSSGLANSSGELGHNLMDHIKGGGATCIIPGNEDRVTFGNRPNIVYMPRFRNVRQKQSGFLRGYGFQGEADREGWDRGTSSPAFGADFKRAISRPGPWHFTFSGYGECLPNHGNFVEIDKSTVDAWGIPSLKIRCAFGENEFALRKDMSIAAAEMLSAAGALSIQPFMDDDPPGFSIHEMGTARMGRDPKTSVLNSWNQCHDIKNLFITDGASMASSSCVNPSLTYMALTARACDHAVSLMKRGEL
jgi:choline dehydrogenase-like flavoprotein